MVSTSVGVEGAGDIKIMGANKRSGGGRLINSGGGTSFCGDAVLLGGFGVALKFGVGVGGERVTSNGGGTSFSGDGTVGAFGVGLRFVVGSGSGRATSSGGGSSLFGDGTAGGFGVGLGLVVGSESGRATSNGNGGGWIVSNVGDCGVGVSSTIGGDGEGGISVGVGGVWKMLRKNIARLNTLVGEGEGEGDGDCAGGLTIVVVWDCWDLVVIAILASSIATTNNHTILLWPAISNSISLDCFL